MPWENVKGQPEVIGEWVEPESRNVQRSPSTYAADWETLRTKPGRYPVKVISIDGRPWGPPYYLYICIDADRVAGRMYSGFAGNNFASRELPLHHKPLVLQVYAYMLEELVNEGHIVPNEAGVELLAYQAERTRAYQESKEREVQRGN